jgi:hypothetical protein
LKKQLEDEMIAGIVQEAEEEEVLEAEEGVEEEDSSTKH